MPRNAEQSEATRVRMEEGHRYISCTQGQLDELHPARIDARLCRMVR